MIRKDDLIVVTADQKRDGYLLKIGDTIVTLPYENIGKLPDGTYLVTYSHRIEDA